MILPTIELPSLNPERAAAVQRRSDLQTKPLGSLGRLEALAAQVAAIQDTDQPRADRAMIMVFAADHGVTVQGVSAWPSEVTAQMVHNFAAGGAAVNVLANSFDIQLQIVDAGVAVDLSALDGIEHRKVGAGTAVNLLGWGA